MLYLGIDQSLTSSGISVIPSSGHRPEYVGTVPTGSLRGAQRLAFIRNELEFVIRKYTLIEHAAIEGYSMDSVNRAFDLGELGGIIRLYLYDAGIPFVVVPPTSLKKFVASNGQATKEAMRQKVLKKWQQDIDQNDACDAYGLAQVARAFSQPRHLVTDRAELEVLVSLDSKPPTPLMLSKGRTKVDY